MTTRSVLGVTVLLAVFPAIISDVGAQQRLRETPDPASRTIQVSPGIHTERLSPRELRAWRAIEAIVFATDDSGRFSHPRLQSLWQWAETSGHVIYIELRGRKHRSDSLAGGFKIEELDPEGHRHIAVIELCLPLIDQAPVSEKAGPGYSFIRFEGLGKKERYAEILGHELGHAVWILGDESRARLVNDLDREIDFYSRRRQTPKREAWDEEMWEHLSRVESWKRTAEEPARTAEAEVWRELLESRGKRTTRHD